LIVFAKRRDGFFRHLLGMKYHSLHPWDITPRQAMRIQEDLRSRVVLKNEFGDLKVIAGADVALDKKRGQGYAGAIAYAFPELGEIERQGATGPLHFPYVPGLLAFREAPILLEALEALKVEPDLIIFDGQGRAHPRRMGIATHMGILLDTPTIGCAKSRLIGTHGDVGPEVGDYASLSHENQVVGAVLRTRRGIRPIFVSPGHKIDLPTSIAIIMKCLDGYRVPKPTRKADHYVGAIKGGEFAKPSP
jgi:deoxyribonuclease V